MTLLAAEVAAAQRPRFWDVGANCGHPNPFEPMQTNAGDYSLQSVTMGAIEYTLQSVKHNSARFLQPTLWRTCRALANRKRLYILALLARGSAQTVSDVAGCVKLSLPTASQYLRALEARGLLTCHRVGRRVEYCLADGRGQGSADQIVAALRRVLGRGGNRSERLFKFATAFTHPRRVEVFRAISKGADSFHKIQAATRIPGPALRRQLEKLQARGFIAGTRGAFAARIQGDPFARALARLAIGY